MYYNKALSKALFGKGVTLPSTKGILKSQADISNYTADDFLKYWKAKAKEHNITYVAVKYKDKAILKSLINNFTKEDIKLMMDYLWDSGEPIMLKDGQLQYTSYGLFLLSQGFLNNIYNRATWWKRGITPKSRGWESKNGGEVEIDF